MSEKVSMCPKTGVDHNYVRMHEVWYFMSTWAGIQTFEDNLRFVEVICKDCSLCKKVSISELTGITG